MTKILTCFDCMKYNEVQNHARTVAWAENISLLRVEQDAQERSHWILIKAKLDKEHKVANTDFISIQVSKHRDDMDYDSLGTLSISRSDNSDLMCAYIQISSVEFDKFIDFMHCYGIERPNLIYFDVSVYEPNVQEDTLRFKHWNGNPTLKIVNFKYYFDFNYHFDMSI